MTNTAAAPRLPLFVNVKTAWRDVGSSFERFCLTAGIGAIKQMLQEDAARLASFDGEEMALSSWMAVRAEDWRGRWAMNLMLIQHVNAQAQAGGTAA